MAAVGKTIKRYGGQRHPACTQNKVGYPTDAAAVLALSELNRMFDTQRRLVSAATGEDVGQLTSYYECQTCGLWHLTSRPGPLPPTSNTKTPTERETMNNGSNGSTTHTGKAVRYKNLTPAVDLGRLLAGV